MHQAIAHAINDEQITTDVNPATIPTAGGEKGMVCAGYLADLVVLSEDIFAVPPEQILRVHVDMTVSDGRIVHRRDAFA